MHGFQVDEFSLISRGNHLSRQLTRMKKEQRKIIKGLKKRIMKKNLASNV